MELELFQIVSIKLDSENIIFLRIVVQEYNNLVKITGLFYFK